MRFLSFWRLRKNGRSASFAERKHQPRNLPQLPANVVKVILQCVAANIAQCPEDGLDACAACSMRDLARCARINRLWHREATPLLYYIVDLDVAHSCDAAVTSVTRTRRKPLDPIKSPSQRLELLVRTLIDNQQLATHVDVLKAASVRDDASFSNIARLARLLHQLREIDLPVAFHKAASSTLMLRRELEDNCSKMRSTIYCCGSESYFTSLAYRDFWPNLEVLELSQLSVEAITIRKVLARLGRLRVLKLSQLSVGDTLFAPIQDVPSICPLQELHIEDDLGVTYAGVSSYLCQVQMSATLQSLSLVRTRISVLDMQRLISIATNLEHMTLSEEVEYSLYVHLLSLSPPQTLENQPLMASRSLRTLTLDISPSRNCSWADARSHYDYLLPSIQGNLLPNLCKVLVLDPNFVERLLHSHSKAPRYANAAHTATAPAKPLEVYTKGSSELPWSSATLATYYMSNVDSKLEQLVDAAGIGGAVSPWIGGARKSVLLSNGVGNYSPIPQLPVGLDSQGTSGGLQSGKAFIATQRVDSTGISGDRRSKMDLWR